MKALATSPKKRRQVTYAPSGSSDKHFNLIRTEALGRFAEAYRQIAKICPIEHKDLVVDIMHKLRTATMQAILEARDA